MYVVWSFIVILLFLHFDFSEIIAFAHYTSTAAHYRNMPITSVLLYYLFICISILMTSFLVVKDRGCSLHRSPHRQWQLPAGVRRVRLRRGHGPSGRVHRQELQEPSLQPRQLPRSSVRQNISR